MSSDEIARLQTEVALLKTQYRCYSCKQVFNEDHGHGLAREHFGSAYRGDLPKCCEVIDGKATWGGGDHDPFYRVRKDHYEELITRAEQAESALAIAHQRGAEAMREAAIEKCKQRVEAWRKPPRTMIVSEAVASVCETLMQAIADTPVPPAGEPAVAAPDSEVKR